MVDKNLVAIRSLEFLLGPGRGPLCDDYSPHLTDTKRPKTPSSAAVESTVTGCMEEDLATGDINTYECRECNTSNCPYK